MSEAIIFSDGSSRGNPGPGGFGSIVVSDDEVFELGDREDNTTNNRMEMRGAIEALEYLAERGFQDEVVVYTDSSYLVNGITKWIGGWISNNWKTKANGDVSNKDLWQRLIPLTKKIKIKWNLIPGHSGIPGNERCDEIATCLAQKLSINLYSGKLKDYNIDINKLSVNINTHKSSSSSGKAFSYVSSIQGVTKIHKSWKECEDRVKGKSGARYRKALSEEHEAEIMREFSK